MLSLSADKKDVSVYQGQDGEIDLTVSGGVGPFTYSWSNDMNTEDLADIPAGEYTVRVIDARGQEAELSVTINQPDELIAEVGDDLGKILNLNPIYFDLNSSYIRSDAKTELDKIVKVMNENPELTVEIGSHTDCRASEKYNMWLSDRRAKSTLQYIQGRISNPARIDGNGYGESKLVNDCACEGEQVSDCSEEQHQLNRRTEFVIVKR
jgi:outer membrane protein OmpA-like peptidoglycan-associated protein